MSILVYKIKGNRSKFKYWERKKKHQMNEELYEIDRGILTLLHSKPLGILNEQEHDLMLSVKLRKEKYLAHELLTWKLKSRIKWSELGDSNTKFFHGHASTCRNFNAIWELKMRMGGWWRRL